MYVCADSPSPSVTLCTISVLHKLQRSGDEIAGRYNNVLDNNLVLRFYKKQKTRKERERERRLNTDIVRSVV
jgi:hypothetical protein